MAEKLFLLVFVLLPPALTIVALVIAYFNNKFVNPHPDRQWLAIRNVLTSKIRFIKQGAAYRMPWWKLDTEVRINKEESSTPPGGHTANTKFGGQVKVEARYNVLTGREFDYANGQLVKKTETVDGIQITHEAGAVDKFVLMAITRTNFSDRARYVAEVFSATIDFVIGLYNYDELMAPTEQKDEPGKPITVYVPREDLGQGVNAAYNLSKKPITSKGELLQALAAYIERECNFRLRDVGFNVDEVQLGDLRPASAEVQADLDRQQRMRSRRRSMREYEGKDTDGKDIDLTHREKLADIEDLPDVAKAVAQMKIAEAIAQSAKDIAEGLKNFGKGT